MSGGGSHVVVGGVTSSVVSTNSSASSGASFTKTGLDPSSVRHVHILNSAARHDLNLRSTFTPASVVSGTADLTGKVVTVDGVEELPGSVAEVRLIVGRADDGAVP